MEAKCCSTFRTKEASACRSSASKFLEKKRVRPQRKINQVEDFVILAYTRYIDCESAKDYTGELSGCSDNLKKNILTTLVGQLGGKNILTTSFSTSSTTASTAACHARGSSSRTRANYRQCSGARHQLAPECGSSRSRPTISSTSATRRSQQRSGAR
jgi:hypothetical protein